MDRLNYLGLIWSCRLLRPFVCDQRSGSVREVGGGNGIDDASEICTCGRKTYQMFGRILIVCRNLQGDCHIRG